jgi:cobalt-zinc-cadmium efflux system membrane fusion protein
MYEEDLPAVLAMPRPIAWQVRVQADATIAVQAGTVDYIGDIIDPNQHTALVSGTITNPRGRLRAGQFVEATILVPPPPGMVAIPPTALLEDGRECVVFVQVATEEPIFELRRVVVDWRDRDVVHIAPRGGKQDRPGPMDAPLRPGERVVTAGAVELRQALEDLAAAGKH